MNWTRGLIRLGLVVSLAWVAVNLGEAQSVIARAQSDCASVRYNALTPPPKPAQKTAFSRMMEDAARERGEQYQDLVLTHDDRIALGEQICRMKYQSAAEDIAGYMVAVPVAIFIGPVSLFLIGAWVVRGFQRQEAQA
jgi:hypothetical protein